MKNLLILLAALLAVIAGAFLPELLLSYSTGPEIKLDYQQVSITSQSAPDYAWRMDRIAELHFGEGEKLFSTYLSDSSAMDQENDRRLFLNELNRLIALGAIPQTVGETLTDWERVTILYHHIFDSEAVSGFRIAEFTASGPNWSVSMTLDMESGKLAKIRYGGSLFFPGGNVQPMGNTSWYDMLHGYADYLGLNGTVTIRNEHADEPNRQYYESCTADRLAARVSPGSASWMELRALRENQFATIAVYDGGK